MPTSVKNVIIDPNGDAVLILRYPIYDLDFISPPAQEDTPSTASNESSLTVDPAHTFSIENLEDNLNDLSLDAVAETADNEGLYHDGPEFHYLVSSGRLCVASPYFHNIFKHGFQEAIPEDDGKYYFSAEDFHPEALTHVLNLAHMQREDVPDRPTLDLLAHIAVIIDYYQLDIFLAQWLRCWRYHFRTPSSHVPCYQNEAFLGLFVALVFGWKYQFATICRAIILSWDDFTQEVIAPFDAIMERMFHHRQKHIGALSRAIDRFETALEAGHVGCPAEGCHSIIKEYIESLRTQARRLTRKKGASYSEVVCTMRDGGTWYRTTYSSNKYRKVMRRTPCCPVGHPGQDPLSLNPSIEAVRFELENLDIKDFGFIVDDNNAKYHGPEDVNGWRLQS